ncbi:MAG TPA: hypothetical protein VN108_01950 [Marmoricola sp.]|nr:hypothetical protein [Marmoricola sp.]
MRRLRLAAPLVIAVLAGCSSTVTTSITPPKPTAINPTDQAQRSQDAVDAFATELVNEKATGSTAAVTTALTAGHLMHVSNATFQYVDSTALTSDDIAQFGSSAWAAEISASYRLPFDPGPTEMTMAMVFKPTATGAEIVSIGGHGDRSALWLDGPTRISIGKRLVVIDAVPSSLNNYVGLGNFALSTVAKVLPNWKGTLVIEVPQSQAQLDDVLQTAADQLTDIAAVTTTADGTLTNGSPIHVFANPDVFNTMTSLGARVVMSHESTHVATQGPLTTMPTWMLEGFADFVALDHSGIPVQTAAHQIIARMASQGIPTHLPTPEDLVPTAGGLGATYEEAWLAWRYLGLTYGEAKAVAFYYAVKNGASVGNAFKNVLGTSESAFVQGWRADLSGLVSQRTR